MKRFLISLVAIFTVSIASSLCAAEKKIDYGFEDWSGDIASTPGYIFVTSSEKYCDTHQDTSEVITSYNANEMGQTWTPHSGEYFFIQFL